MKKEEEKSPHLMAVVVDLCKPNRVAKVWIYNQSTNEINVTFLYYYLSSLLSNPVSLLVPALMLILPWQATRGCQSGRKLIQGKKKSEQFSARSLSWTASARVKQAAGSAVREGVGALSC